MTDGWYDMPVSQLWWPNLYGPGVGGWKTLLTWGEYLGADTQPSGDAARKDDSNKPRLDLVPPEAIHAAARAFTFGSRKYAAWNWSKGMAWLRLYGALQRHLLAWVLREEHDPESGLSHLDHAMASLAMLTAHQARGLGTDDRPTYAIPAPSDIPHSA